LGAVRRRPGPIDRRLLQRDQQMRPPPHESRASDPGLPIFWQIFLRSASIRDDAPQVQI